MAQILVLLPPIIAIGLALITKEVYSSLFIGVLVGAFIFVLSGGVVVSEDGSIISSFFVSESMVQPEGVLFQHTDFQWHFSIMETINTTFNTIVGSVADSYNVGILLFLVLLGMLVALVTKAGGSRAYGDWATSKIKSKKTALLSTSALGAIIFVDDYFNCLTVGTVMKPVTDKHKISRAKLAYIIDSTAAPICIIAPVSSWGAAITGQMSAENAFSVFLQTIPFNFYALFTIIFLIAIVCMNFDFGLMKKIEDVAKNTGDLGDNKGKIEEPEFEISGKGTIWDLLVPIIVLILGAILAMIYTGGGFAGVDILTAFSDCEAPTSLCYGAFTALLCALLMYLPRKVIKPREYMQSLVQGFKSMVPAISILVLAWSLGGICKSNETLNLGGNISLLFNGSSLLVIMPAILFIVAAFIGFSTGTSWGTMAILIPLAEGLFGVTNGATVSDSLLIICIASVAAGAVLGDHISPISDTTIMASTGSQCDHLQHVSSQMPYALSVGAVCVVTFLVAGLTAGMGYGWSLAISWVVGLLGLFGLIFGLKIYQKKKGTKIDEMPEQDAE